MATEPFDPALYTRAPVLTIASAISLGKSLVAACPKGMPASVKKSCKQLENKCVAAQSAWADRQRELGVVSEEDSRALDVATDNVWGALRMRLHAYAVLPAERFPRAPRAGELIVVLFGEDMPFLQAKYPIQFETMDTILKRVDEDKLAKEIDELAGPEFLDQIRHLHPRYSAMVRAMIQRDDRSGHNLLDHVRDMQRAIVNYATKVCATVEDDEPETVEAARKALRAIETFRMTGARRGGNGGSGEEIEPKTDMKPVEGAEPK